MTTRTTSKTATMPANRLPRATANVRASSKKLNKPSKEDAAIKRERERAVENLSDEAIRERTANQIFMKISINPKTDNFSATGAGKSGGYKASGIDVALKKEKNSDFAYDLTNRIAGKVPDIQDYISLIGLKPSDAEYLTADNRGKYPEFFKNLREMKSQISRSKSKGKGRVLEPNFSFKEIFAMGQFVRGEKSTGVKKSGRARSANPLSAGLLSLYNRYIDLVNSGKKYIDITNLDNELGQARIVASVPENKNDYEFLNVVDGEDIFFVNKKVPIPDKRMKEIENLIFNDFGQYYDKKVEKEAVASQKTKESKRGANIKGLTPPARGGRKAGSVERNAINKTTGTPKQQ